MDRIILTRSGGEKIELRCPFEPATAIELAKFMVEARHAHERSATSELSDAGVEKLVNLAFNLSIREDEGRFPRLRVISGTLEDHRLAARFATPSKFDDVHELRRLAPVAGAPDFALLVAESSDGNLYCPGLANIGCHLTILLLLGFERNWLNQNDERNHLHAFRRRKDRAGMSFRTCDGYRTCQIHRRSATRPRRMGHL